MNIPCLSIPRGGLRSTLGGDSLAPCICPAPLGSSKIDGREADEISYWPRDACLVVLTLVGPPDAVIANGPGGIAPDFTSTAAAETPNECIELGQTFLFSGTYHCRHAMTVPEPPFRGSCVELALLLVADLWGACGEEEDDGWPAWHSTRRI